MTALKGVIAATPTPVMRDRLVDTDRLIEHCRRLLEGGCDGINLLGTTGEATSFSVSQRIEIMKAVASSSLPLDRFMVGTGASALEDAIVLTRTAKSLGFAGALLLPPFYYKGIEASALTSYVEAVITGAGPNGLKLYLYHFPSNSGVPYSAAVVKALRESHPDVVTGLKDSSGDLEYSANLARELPGFDVFPSAEGSLAHAADRGFAGCISATANVTAKFAQAAWSGSGIARSEGLRSAIAVREAISTFPLIAAVKATVAILAKDGVWESMMPPLAALATEQMKELRFKLSATPLSADLS